MDKKKKSRIINIVFLIGIILLIVPQTRTPIQVLLHKGLSVFGPSVIEESKRESMTFQNWSLQDLDGDVVDFKSFEGEVTIINFWATWCPPCIAEMPSIQSLYDDYNGKVNILLISNEESPIIEKFLSKNNYKLRVFRPLSSYPDNLNITSIPRTLIVSKNGEIVIDKKGAANWNSSSIRSELDRLLSE